jgi:hypothetical protein
MAESVTLCYTAYRRDALPTFARNRHVDGAAHANAGAIRRSGASRFAVPSGMN